MSGKTNWVVEADIKGFFDHVDHDWLMKFLAHVIQDKTFLRYIKRFLIAGIMEDGELKDSTEGTPQGGLISPILANVYLHYVLDLWVTYAVIPNLQGEAHYVRYADDFVILCQNEEDARNVLTMLKERLAKFSLEVAEDKTRILPFGPRTETNEEFDFLGFTFYNTTTRKGHYRIGILTCMKKFKAKMQTFKQWIKKKMHANVRDTLESIGRKYKGHLNYYSINGNFKMISKFRWYIETQTFKTLRRRGQKGKIPWEVFSELWEAYIPPAEILVKIWY